MRITAKFLVFSLLVGGLIFGEALADEVSLKNGDRLSGEVIALEADKLIFKTSYAGQIFIAWSGVQKIRVDKPVEVLLKDGISLSGVIETTEDGSIIVTVVETRERVRVNFAEVERINPKPVESPKTKYNIRANVGTTVESGNTEKEKLHLEGRLVARRQRHRFSFEFEYEYETNNNEETKNKLLASSNYDYFFRHPWYAYGKGAYEFDEFKDLNLKLDVGPGLGYQFFEGEIANLAIEAGPSFVKQEFKKEARRNYVAARAAIRADKWFFDKLFQYYLFVEGFTNPNETDDRFVRARTGLRFPLGWGLNLSTQYNLDYDNSPPEGIDDTDQKFFFLLGYDK